MGPVDTSVILLDGMRMTLDRWASAHGGERDLLYWLLRLKVSELDGARRDGGDVPQELRGVLESLRQRTDTYWGDVRYATLEPVTILWGTIVNALRVAAGSGRATEGQKAIFDLPVSSLVTFFASARDRMEVADSLYHAFKAMPAPECQALAALLNVHVDARLDAPTLVRLVRLLDHEGPMSREESDALAALAKTHLVDAAFSGLRAHA